MTWQTLVRLCNALDLCVHVYYCLSFVVYFIYFCIFSAVYDGSDALMLSDETGSGQYPTEAVLAMASIAHVAELTMEQYGRLDSPAFTQPEDSGPLSQYTPEELLPLPLVSTEMASSAPEDRKWPIFVTVVGPPGSGKTSLCQELSKNASSLLGLPCVHVSPGNLLRVKEAEPQVGVTRCLL